MPDRNRGLRPDLGDLCAACKASTPDSLAPSDIQTRQADVLVIVSGPHDGPVMVHMIRRSEHMRTNPGQIAFVGGRYDPTDRTLQRTALREAHEEVGVDPEALEIIGPLPTVLSVPDRIPIHPFVAVAAAGTELRTGNEVAEVISFSLSDLLAPGVHREESRLDSDGLPVHSFTIGDRSIVAGSATILACLLTRLQEITTNPPSPEASI